MNKLFKTKYILIFIYLSLIFFFYSLFFDFQFNKDLVVEFLIDNKEKFDFYIEKNFINLLLLFFIFSILWTIFLGFGLPTMILTAYLFEPISGTIFLVLSKSIGVSIIFFFYHKTFYSYLSKKINFNRINKNKISNEKYLTIWFEVHFFIKIFSLSLVLFRWNHRTF